MYKFLNHFEKRMEFTAVVDSLVNRKNKITEIESKFDEFEIDNLLLTVLVFIMESSLADDHDCTLYSISHFLSEILPLYGKNFSAEETEAFTRYLVKDILQNKGDKRSFKVMDYGKEAFGEVAVRLISDHANNQNEIVYELTRQGYDFLFRTKEVDDKLGFKIEQIRLQLQIEHSNYHEAAEQSSALVKMLLQKQRELDQFMRQLRSDITQVSTEKYDIMSREINNMLSEEYEMMQKVEQTTNKVQEKYRKKEEEFGTLSDEDENACRDIFRILENVKKAIFLQRKLINKSLEAEKLYVSVLEDSIYFQKHKRYNFEDEILLKFQNISFKNADNAEDFCKKMIAPLCLPSFEHILNLNLIYDKQSKPQEESTQQTVTEEEVEEESAQEQRLRRRTQAHIKTTDSLLRYAAHHDKSFTLSDFCGELEQMGLLQELCTERILFLDMLRLYSMQLIDLERWREKNDEWVQESSGEFDLPYCLGEVSREVPDLYGIKSIAVACTGEHFTCRIPVESTAEGITETAEIQTDNLQFEVKK